MSNPSERRQAVTIPGSSSSRGSGYGVLAGCGAHLFWGFSVLFWPLLKELPSVSLLSHRMPWSCAFMLLLLVITGRWNEVRAAVRDRRTFGILAGSAFILSFNWGLYLWAVNSGNVVESSLGYYITPLLNVIMGRVLLGERISRGQGLAILLAVLGVAWGIIQFGHVPWLAFILATTFAVYGYLQKTIRVEAAPSLFVETAVLAPVALAWLAYTHPGDFAIIGYGPLRPVLLAGTIMFTAIPLLLFSFAARHITLSTIGILQYVSPSISFLLAIFVLGEKIKPSDMVTFPLIWCALIIYTWDALRNMRALQTRARAMARKDGGSEQ